MRWFCLCLWLLLLLCTLPANSNPKPKRPDTLKEARPPHLDTVLAYVGVTETGTNRGGMIDVWLASVGLRPGYPWCAALQSWALKVSGVTYPLIRSARARAFITGQSVSARDVVRGLWMPPPGTLVIWGYGDPRNPLGHIGQVVQYLGEGALITVEGNTSDGSTREGNCVAIKRRFIRASVRRGLRITDFTPVFYGDSTYTRRSSVPGSGYRLDPRTDSRMARAREPTNDRRADPRRARPASSGRRNVS